METGDMKIRFLFVLIVFFAGMATGIYISAPGQEADTKSEDRNFAASAVRSDEFAAKLNTHLHKGLQWGKEAAEKTSQMVKEKISEHQLRSDG